MLFLIKYSFYAHNGFYTLLITENNLSKNFETMTELDLYIKYLMINDFIEVFFDSKDIKENVNMIKNMEIYSNELLRAMFILFDSCCRVFSSINNKKENNNEINIKEIYNKGYQMAEIVQVIQEGKKNNEDIIKQIDEYRKKEKEKEENKVDIIKKKEEKMNIENYKEKEIEKTNEIEENDKKNNEIRNRYTNIFNNIFLRRLLFL